ncbi:MAG: hypothetical protein L0287_32110, partial [Anaerolineae bacterium]|nr:hypothetical protein [Anaerolineae bacterium]
MIQPTMTVMLKTSQGINSFTQSKFNKLLMVSILLVVPANLYPTEECSNIGLAGILLCARRENIATLQATAKP